MTTAHTHATMLTCQVCGKSFRPSEVAPSDILHGALFDRIHAKHPEVTADSYLCLEDLNRLRREYIEEDLAAEHGELDALQQEVMRSIQENETIVKNLNTAFSGKLSFGDRVADKVAEFGGSWSFIITFGAIILVWMAVNSLAFLIKPFDPMPFMALNLVLSCVAAMQAPVIMMSQNRQEAKDRMRAEQDFRTNLKAEVEIRTLHAKIDELVSHQWQRLLEIQQIQTDMMEQITCARQPTLTTPEDTTEQAPA